MTEVPHRLASPRRCLTSEYLVPKVASRLNDYEIKVGKVECEFLCGASAADVAVTGAGQPRGIAGASSAEIISERLGHSTAAFTLQTYTQVIPGMDEEAAPRTPGGGD